MLYRIAVKCDGKWEWASYLDPDQQRVQRAYSLLRESYLPEEARIVAGYTEWAITHYLIILNSGASPSKKRADIRRLQLEEGKGGDHDQRYQFALPNGSYRAWGRLISRVQQASEGSVE